MGCDRQCDQQETVSYTLNGIILLMVFPSCILNPDGISIAILQKFDLIIMKNPIAIALLSFYRLLSYYYPIIVPTKP